MRIDIVVPCFNEERALPETARRLLGLLTSLQGDGRITAGSRLLFVDDGSRDRTWAVISELARGDPRIAGVKLSRNRGHQTALLAGLLHSRAEATISIDADLQDDIGVVPEMLDHLRKGSDIVLGIRRRRPTDSLFKRVSAAAYYRLMAWLGVDLVEQHADFRLLSRRALDCLREYREVHLFIRGLIPQLGFACARVYYDRQPRLAGDTKYPVRRMLALGVEGLTSFSAVPLRLFAALGVLAFLLSLALTGWVLWIRFASSSAVPGWASTVIPVYFIGGLQLLGIGVVGEYVARIFMEVKQRPRFFVESTIGAEPAPEDARAPAPRQD